jgi:hypothetical protein
MAKIDNWQDPELKEAVLIWSGYGDSNFPRRDSMMVQRRFGYDANKWISTINFLVDDFYETEAERTAEDISEMWSISVADFKSKFPDAPDEITKALAWCYTFDNR